MRSEEDPILRLFEEKIMIIRPVNGRTKNLFISYFTAVFITTDFQSFPCLKNNVYKTTRTATDKINATSVLSRNRIFRRKFNFDNRFKEDFEVKS